MPSSKTLNAANLETLGAPKLADLLLEISKGSAASQRRLRLALAGGSTAQTVAKQLASIARSKTWLNSQKIKPFLTELEQQHRAIVDLIAPRDPGEAFDLLWRLVECAEGVFARSDDGSNRLSNAFHAAAQDLGPLAQRAAILPEDLADRAVRALIADGYDVWDELIPILAPQLETAGLTLIRDAVQAWGAEPMAALPAGRRRVIGWATSGPIYADEIASSHRGHTTRFVLQQVADALGDVESYIAQVEARARVMPGIAANIAQRLLASGRPQEALAALDAVEPERREGTSPEWEQSRLEALEALGRPEEAQDFRWERFTRTLNATHLRVYLGKLPDFEDFEAEQRALAYAQAFPELHRALAFLVAWPDLKRASDLVLDRAPDLNGNVYETLSPAAAALETRHPLAATLLRRAMIGYTLEHARTSRYKHAARHFRDCQHDAARIEDFGAAPTHQTYEKSLRATHGRKAAFWQEVDKLG